MAQGQTTRNNLSMRNPDDVPGSLREVKRWADRLPLGAAGFHVRHSANQTVNAATTITLSFDTIIRNLERWYVSATSLIVPPGLSGVYALNAGAYWQTQATPIYLSIRVNGFCVGPSPTPEANVTRTAASCTTFLKEGDVLSVGILNSSAGAITVTALTPLTDPHSPQQPHFSGWRISLR